ncbi:hypothetical protein [Actinoplanes sp. ATCC 53533]|uniref:hypothetical protein n=1 Tax=Actinoplanes sp. ATCC 53533 TaxID=1288362 RepID=UPI000F77FFA9|nr:hypothetical protein [Actinoplanes sp. ATCC 53533]
MTRAETAADLKLRHDRGEQATNPPEHITPYPTALPEHSAGAFPPPAGPSGASHEETRRLPDLTPNVPPIRRRRWLTRAANIRRLAADSWPADRATPAGCPRGLPGALMEVRRRWLPGPPVGWPS